MNELSRRSSSIVSRQEPKPAQSNLVAMAVRRTGPWFARRRQPVRGCAIGLVAIAMVTLVCRLSDVLVSTTDIVPLYLLVVLLIAIFYGTGPAVLIAVT